MLVQEMLHRLAQGYLIIKTVHYIYYTWYPGYTFSATAYYLHLPAPATTPPATYDTRHLLSRTTNQLHEQKQQRFEDEPQCYPQLLIVQFTARGHFGNNNNNINTTTTTTTHPSRSEPICKAIIQLIM